MRKLLITLIFFGSIPVLTAQDGASWDRLENQPKTIQLIIGGSPTVININRANPNAYDNYDMETIPFDEYALDELGGEATPSNGVIVINLQEQGVTLVLTRPGSEIVMEEGIPTEGGHIIPDEEEPQGGRTSVTFIPELGVTIIRAPQSINQ